ncbi:dual specificity protein kinase shkE-like [Dysidea avara]|uniref:dual specificity protein kinase shkE-like n=1 Tax=Dysidea avara TaxID=196820 RepID=UPI00331985CD
MYYLKKSCKQNISQFSQEDQAKINDMVAEYERTHPEEVRMQSSQVERKVQVGVKELQIRDHQDHQLLQQIQQVVTQLQATVSAEQQKTVSLERRCQELEYNNQLLQSQNQSVQTSLSAEQQKTNGLLERIKTLEDTVERLWAISREEIQLSNNILGTGGWGYVKEATFRGRRVAAKCLHEAIVSPHNQDLFAKEMKISARCRHKNLVEFIGAVPDHPAIIVIEMMDCTLRLALTNGRATPNHIHPICIDVAQGLVYLHGVQPNPIIHRDVSAPNVLLKAVTTGWIAKLSDLGSAQFANIAQTLAPGCVLYAAPEVQQRNSARHQTVKMDVFSFGVLLIEMLTREMPTGTIAELIATIRPLWPRFVPLIQRCTNSNPNNRPSMREVITTLNTIVM